MIIVIAADRWPNPRKSVLVSGPEADPGKARRDFYAQRSAAKHDNGLPVLLYCEVQPQVISITTNIEAKQPEPKGKSK